MNRAAEDILATLSDRRNQKVDSCPTSVPAGSSDSVRVIAVSACLMGEPCRYDGASKQHAAVKRCVRSLQEQGYAIVRVCPEVAGGLPTPRTPSEILPSGRVVFKTGEDVTDAFRYGADAEFARMMHAGVPVLAILKERSPSCGSSAVYDGTFSGTLVAGQGVFAMRVSDAHIPILSEEDVQRILQRDERPEKENKD